jgi:hypothetical protein
VKPVSRKILQTFTHESMWQKYHRLNMQVHTEPVKPDFLLYIQTYTPIYLALLMSAADITRNPTTKHD